MKLYKVICHSSKVFEVEVEMIYDRAFRLRGDESRNKINMRNPEGEWQYFFTKKEANEYLLDIARRNVREKEGALDYAKDWLSRLEEAINSDSK